MYRDQIVGLILESVNRYIVPGATEKRSVNRTPETDLYAGVSFFLFFEQGMQGYLNSFFL